MKSLKARMEALEAARWARLTPLEGAEDLAERGLPPEQWPDDALNAYCGAHCQDLKHLTDAELEALLHEQKS